MAKDDRISGKPGRSISGTSGGCGETRDIAQADGVRVSRCTCGVVHLHVIASGLTLRLSAERFTVLADAIATARRVLDAEAETTEAGGPPIH
jgi:hypothetical protein